MSEEVQPSPAPPEPAPKASAKASPPARAAAPKAAEEQAPPSALAEAKALMDAALAELKKDPQSGASGLHLSLEGSPPDRLRVLSGVSTFARISLPQTGLQVSYYAFIPPLESAAIKLLLEKAGVVVSVNPGGFLRPSGN